MTDDEKSNLGTTQKDAHGTANADASSRYIHSDVWDRLAKGTDELTAFVAYGIYTPITSEPENPWV